MRDSAIKSAESRKIKHLVICLIIINKYYFCFVFRIQYEYQPSEDTTVVKQCGRKVKNKLISKYK